MNLSRYLIAFSTKLFFLEFTSSLSLTNPNCVLSSSDKTCSSTVVNVTLESCLLVTEFELLDSDWFCLEALSFANGAALVSEVELEEVVDLELSCSELEAFDVVSIFSTLAVFVSLADAVEDGFVACEVEMGAPGDLFVAPSFDVSTFVMLNVVSYNQFL